MTLWIGNGAILKSSSQWELKEYRKLNSSSHELFILKILKSMDNIVTVDDDNLLLYCWSIY